MSRAQVLAASFLFLGWALVYAKPLPPGRNDKDAGLDKPFVIKDMEKKVWHISFPANKKAEIKVASENDADVDLFVEEMDGTEVIEDIDPSKDCSVEFTPLKQKTYRISVINLGPGENKCKVTHNGTVESPNFGKTAETKPFKVAEDGMKEFNLKFKEGQLSAVWVHGTRDSDVDLFVFDPDGREVASDEHVSKDCFVSFVPKSTGTYRVEVRNLGPGANTSTLKHTAVLEEKREKND